MRGVAPNSIAQSLSLCSESAAARQPEDSSHVLRTDGRGVQDERDLPCHGTLTLHGARGKAGRGDGEGIVCTVLQCLFVVYPGRNESYCYEAGVIVGDRLR